MKKHLRLPAALLAAGWIAASSAIAAMPKEAVEPTAKGSLKIGEVLFTVRCFDGAWRNFTQESAVFTVTEREAEPARFRLRADFRQTGFPAGTLTESLDREAADRYRYRAELVFSAPVKFNDIAFAAAALPVDEFAGREFIIDGKTKIVLPATPGDKSKTALFRGEATELAFPLADRSLIFRGRFGVLIQDDRAFGKEVYTLRIFFTPARGEITRSTLDLAIETSRYRSTPLDLASAANAGFADETADDRKGGWTDQGPENDLAMLLPGTHRWNGVDFEILDPARNNGRSCVMLAGPFRHYFARDAAAEQKGQPRGNYLHLLHATAWPTPDKTVGSVEITYLDGTKSTCEVTGYDVGNWWSPVPRRDGEVVWTAENGSSEVGLYRSSFPIENKPIRSVAFRSTGVSVWGIVAASVGDGPVSRLGRTPRTITAGTEWKPVDSARDIEKGSVLDFSARLDAPAGKYGPVVIRNGRFEFRDRPGEPARFYGTNLCRSAQYLEKDQAERLADRMAAWGINAVRIHHHDNELVRKTKSSSTGLDPEALDRLDYLIDCFKKRGIYVTTDLYVSRMLVPDELPEMPGKTAWQPTFKPLVFVLDSALENWKEFARNWLTHVNPYTGLALRDDPALISLSLINEDNIGNTWNVAPIVADFYKEQFEAWKKEKNLSGGRADRTDPVFSAFLTDLYARKYAEMKRFLLEDLRMDKPVSDQNMLASVLLSVMRNQYDFVENHFYWDHPNFPVTPWQLPSAQANTSAIPQEAVAPGRMFPSRLFGKPMMITEFDYAAPNRFRAEGPVLTGAYAALQEWDGLFQFCYSHSADNVITDGLNTRGHFFNAATDPVKALSQRIGLRLFLDREISPAPAAFAIPLTGGEGLSFATEYPADIARLGLVAKVGAVIVPPGGAVPEGFDGLLDIGHNFPPGTGNTPVFRTSDSDSEKGLPERLAAAGKLPPGSCDAARGIFRAPGGQIALDAKAGTFRAVTPGCEALILPPGKNGQGEFLSVENRTGRGVFSVMSADGKTLRESGRLLLLHLTDALPDRTRFGNKRMTFLTQWGTLPILAARGEASVTLRAEPGAAYRLYAVNTSGKRLTELPLEQSADGTVRFPVEVFRKEGAVFAYELVREGR